MSQLGNLAIVVSKRENVLLQILNGDVAVFVGEGPARAFMSAKCSDDTKINQMIYELNFGKCAETELNKAA